MVLNLRHASIIAKNIIFVNIFIDFDNNFTEFVILVN